MQLKTYQKKVMNDLASYLKILNEEINLNRAWQRYWNEKDIAVGFGGVPSYNNSIKGVPHLCMKVPTGGGKTFMACAAIRHIFDAMPKDKHKVVVWLVPSDAILTQTIKNLSDPIHDYNLRLQADFAGKIGIYTKEMLLNGQNFSPDTVKELLTVCILSYASLRVKNQNKDIRKVYQENGNLIRFAEYFKDDNIKLADTPDTALIQVLRNLSPVTIVDESHNADSDLSVEMLNNLNPSFVLDLTATPKKNSNIISYVDARDLKKENMVKLPVIVYNRTSRNDVIQDAIQLRASIEQQAIEEKCNGGKYVRPIVLFQAQPRTGESSETFDKIKKLLIDMGIPEAEIAIKTSEINEIGDTNLLSETCPIRYIITVNALKEGWDCSFAYILASLANKTSSVDVEQIVGRILRQPYATKHARPLLKTSYVLTCSAYFHATLDKIVVGLNNAGFSRKDFRLGSIVPEQDLKPTVAPVQEQIDTEVAADTYDDIVPEVIRTNIKTEEATTSNSLNEMIQTATTQAQEYDATVEQTYDNGFMGGELGDMLNQYAIQKQYEESVKEIKIPQFYLKTAPDLFGDEFNLLSQENLSEGFRLVGQDANISFELATGEMYRVDIQVEGEAVPKYQRTAKDESAFIREYLKKIPSEKKVTACTDMICAQINKNNRYAQSDIRDYVRCVVARMSEDELKAMETAVVTYAQKIKEKIKALEKAYFEKQFYKWLDSGKIVCKPSYSLPSVITPVETIDSIPFSLYESEKNDMNKFERSVIDSIIGLGNVYWWHRIIDRKDFCINGFIPHYPDFMIMTKKGNLVMVESKGDFLSGEASDKKLELGRKWADCAGAGFKYFMVYENKEKKLDGAYTLDTFLEVMKEL